MKAGNMLADLIEHLATSKQSNKAGFYNYRKSSKGQKVSVLLEDTARKEIFFFSELLALDGQASKDCGLHGDMNEPFTLASLSSGGGLGVA